MTQPIGGHPFLVAGLQASTSKFPPLPSNCSNATKLLNPSLPKEISFAESLKQLAQQSHDSLRRDIIHGWGYPTNQMDGRRGLRSRDLLSRPYLLPTFFVKECLFSLAAVVGKPIQIDQATINKSRPSCARVKVIVDLRKDFPKVIKMNIENETTGEVRSNMVAIKYDYVPKYCFDCKMQGHSNEECRMRKMPQHRDGENFQYNRGVGTKSSNPPPVPSKLPNVHVIQKGKARVLSSGRVVGDPRQWDVVKDLRPPKYQLHVAIKNKFEVLTQNGDEEKNKEFTSNK
ncbi:hypothetical protein H5410_059883 [Solanum commersonii]|uniref:DUF4283 domain-containing protein n=1 Tax=Solanum commersonii TaxID=4109 RepID=A0A9J5W3M3_SOLCO|nr:hypothetical protein H5410_059883 [Solanum commersonii]